MIHRHFSRLLLLAVLPWLAVSCAVRPVEPPPVSDLPRMLSGDSRHRDYVRSMQTGPDHFVLQTGSRVFRKAGAPDIDLVGAIHIASADYYAALQRRLDRADLVLFEGVTEKKDQQISGGGGGNGAYHRLARGVGLEVQHHGIDYTRKHFRRCDLSMEEMNAILEAEIRAGGPRGAEAAEARAEFASLGKALGGRSLMTNLVLSLVGSSHGLRERVRLMMIGVGQDSEEKVMSRRLERLIGEDRERHVMAALRDFSLRRHRRVAVFYGAAHLSAFERDLRSMGYRPVGPTTWTEAFSAHPYAAGIQPDEVRELLKK